MAFRSSLVPALLAGLGLFAHAEDAAACSPPCLELTLAPAQGSTVPASTPGLPVWGLFSDDETVELRTEAGKVVPGFITKAGAYRHFAPIVPLLPGTYTVAATGHCGSPGGTLQRTIAVGEPAPLPSSTGRLAIKSIGRGALAAATSAGSCVDLVDAAFVDLELQRAPSLEPWGAVVAFETRVDGRAWADVGPGGSLDVVAQAGRAVLRVFTACTPASKSTDVGLTPGLHEVEVRAVIVGGPEVSAASLHVRVACDGTNGQPGVDFVPPGKTPDEPVEYPMPVDDLAPEHSPSATGSSTGCVCATGPACPASLPLGIATAPGLVALVALVRARRRR